MVPFLTAALAAPLISIDEPVRTGATARDDFAVVIGIEDYFALPDVPYAQADAAAWSDFFVYTRGIPSTHVARVVGQPSREHLLATLEGAGQTGPSGTVFVVFAGHGAAHLATGAPMIMPAETPMDPAGFAARGIPLEQVHELAGAGGARVVVITDACYTGVDRGGEPLVPGARFAVPAWVAPPAAEDVSWRATDANQVALPLDDVQHGAFSYVAIQALRGGADGERDGLPDGVVTGEEAMLFAQRRLRELGLTSQIPQWQGPQDFVFVDAPGKLEQPAPPRSEAEPDATAQAPATHPLAFLTPTPRDRSDEVAVASKPAVQPVQATSPPAQAVRAQKPPSELRRAIEVEAAFGTWTGLRVVHRWDGLLRRVGLESGLGAGYMDYLSCAATTCKLAFRNDQEVALELAYLPYAHPLTLHVALSPARKGPWSQVDVAGSLGVGVAVHRDILGSHVTGGYTAQARWTHGKRNLWFALGYAGAAGDLFAQTEEPYTWPETHSLLVNVGARIGTLWHHER